MSLDDATARSRLVVAVEEARAGLAEGGGFIAPYPALWHEDIGGDG